MSGKWVFNVLLPALQTQAGGSAWTGTRSSACPSGGWAEAQPESASTWHRVIADYLLKFPLLSFWEQYRHILELFFFCLNWKPLQRVFEALLFWGEAKFRKVSKSRCGRKWFSWNIKTAGKGDKQVWLKCCKYCILECYHEALDLLHPIRQCNCYQKGSVHWN